MKCKKIKYNWTIITLILDSHKFLKVIATGRLSYATQ